LKTAITKGLEPDRAKEITGEFIASRGLRHRLIELFKEKIELSREESCSKNAYVNGQWAYKQADAMGYERAMREFISLLSEK
jgi:hypothetical protein